MLLITKSALNLTEKSNTTLVLLLSNCSQVLKVFNDWPVEYSIILTISGYEFSCLYIPQVHYFTITLRLWSTYEYVSSPFENERVDSNWYNTSKTIIIINKHDVFRANNTYSDIIVLKFHIHWVLCVVFLQLHDVTEMFKTFVINDTPIQYSYHVSYFFFSRVDPTFIPGPWGWRLQTRTNAQMWLGVSLWFYVYFNKASYNYSLNQQRTS